MSTWAIELLPVHRTREEVVREESSDLIERARSDDVLAFREIVERYGSRVYATVYQMVGNPEDAQDIAQEVFLKLYSSLSKFDPEYPLVPWLYRVTVNVVVDYQRRSARHRHASLDEIKDEAVLEDHRPQPDVHTERNELRGALKHILGRLSQKQRKVFILRDLQGFTTEEVARILKCRPTTIRVHLARARGRIKAALLKDYPDLVY